MLSIGMTRRMTFGDLCHCPRATGSWHTSNNPPTLRRLSRCSRPELAAGTALITGITGQDGSYLAELLLEKGYVVHGNCYVEA